MGGEVTIIAPFGVTSTSLVTFFFSPGVWSKTKVCDDYFLFLDNRGLLDLRVCYFEICYGCNTNPNTALFSGHMNKQKLLLYMKAWLEFPKM